MHTGTATLAAALPIDPVLPSITASLRKTPNLVLVAPPGAGKTTRVPLALLGEPWAAGRRIILLEPRRLAARGAAERMAASLGERVGETVGLRVRSDTRVGRGTRLEVVTEGVFTRMILDDPALEGVVAVLFDEVHERSLEGDMGLALARDAQTGLREDLRVVAMSATLDGAAFARLLGDAPVIEAEGRAYPVETRYLGREANEPLHLSAARAVLRALEQETGSVLAFLPGAGEIRRTTTLLSERIDDPQVALAPLYGALSRAEQDAAVAPAPAGRRKVVLATSIAETSLTIEGVRVVVDTGFSRVPRFDPASGLTRLETVRVSRAAADQRRGRAGRTGPGICYRLWDEPQTRALAPQGRPEILEADLGPLVLALAEWGIADPGALPWLDPPPAAALGEARRLLAGLRAVDGDGRITPEGRRLARLPLPPRLAHMVLEGGRLGEAGLAAELAALVSERGLSRETDLRHAVEAFRRDGSGRARDTRDLARAWARLGGDGGEIGRGSTARAGRLLAAAYPDRVAKAREGRPGAYLLAGGRGAVLDPADPLARSAFLAVAELGGGGAESRILSAAPLEQAELEEAFADQIVEERALRFDPRSRAVRLVTERRLGAIVLASRVVPAPPGPETVQALISGLEAEGLGFLPWTPPLQTWRERVAFLRGVEGEPWPDLSDEALGPSLCEWLGPHLADKRALDEITVDVLAAALHTMVPYDLQRRLDTLAPTHFDAPSGSRLPIRYEGGVPVLSVRVQELFGLGTHPTVAGGRVPLTLELLSPAHRPVQVTRDLARFWAGSYAAVRAEMRGRYPKHPWPEDPLHAPATSRAKPRGT